MTEFNKNNTVILVLVAGIVVALFGVMLAEVYSFGVDDSYIFYRYAENAGNGHGFRFNAGEPPGEGFTSWLWLLLLTFSHFLGIAVIPASKVLGVLFHILAGMMVFLTVQRLMENGPLSYLAGLALAAGIWANLRLTAHAVSGMETSLFLFVLLTLVFLGTKALRAPDDDLRWWWILGLSSLVLFWVRPEGIVAGGITLALFAFQRIKDLLKLRTWLYLFVSLILPLALFLLMKYLVFGYIMPHSYYHKIIIDKGEYSAALNHLLRFAKAYWWLIAVALASAFYGGLALKQNALVYFYYGLLFFAMTGLYLFFYPAMNYLHRFYIPYLSLLLLMLVPVALASVRLVSGLKPGTLQVLPLLLIFVALTAGMNSQPAATRRVIRGWTNMVNPAIYRARLGKILAGLPGDVVIANAEMGVIPYYSGLTCIDMAGLTDPHIAHHGLSATYLDKRNASIILFPRDVEKMSPGQWQKYTINYKDVFLSERFTRDFRRIGSYAAWPGGVNRYYIYADTTSSRFPDIIRWLDRNASQLKTQRRSGT